MNRNPQSIAITSTPIAARLFALVGLIVALGLMASGCGVASKTYVENSIAQYHKQHVQPALDAKASSTDVQTLRATTEKHGQAIDAAQKTQKTETARLDTLTTKVDGQGTALGTLQGTVTDHGRTIGAVNATARQLSERVAPIGATVATLDTVARQHGVKIGALDSAVSSHTTSLRTLGQRVASLGKAVNQTTSRVGAIEFHKEIEENVKYVRIPGFPVARRDASDDEFVACAEISPQMKGEIEKVAEAAKKDGLVVSMVYGFADSLPFKKAGKVHDDSDALNAACAEMRAAAGAEVLSDLMEDVIDLQGMGTTARFGDIPMNRTLLVKLVRNTP